MKMTQGIEVEQTRKIGKARIGHVIENGQEEMTIQNVTNLSYGNLESVNSKRKLTLLKLEYR